jgi:hypothetical protein
MLPIGLELFRSLARKNALPMQFTAVYLLQPGGLKIRVMALREEDNVLQVEHLTDPTMRASSSDLAGQLRPQERRPPMASGAGVIVEDVGGRRVRVALPLDYVDTGWLDRDAQEHARMTLRPEGWRILLRPVADLPQKEILRRALGA